MLKEWLETADYVIDKSESRFYLETADWSLILKITDLSRNELASEMSNDESWSNECSPYYIEADVDDHHVIAHNWCGSDWWGILIED